MTLFSQHRSKIVVAVLLIVTAVIWAGMPDDTGVSLEEKKISASGAAVMGVVEGLTEYLPVSSTGHLILARHWMDLSEFSDQEGPFGRKLRKAPAVEAFEIVIQLGAILAVVGLYRKRVGQMGRGLMGKDPSGLRLAALLMTAFLPAAIVGLLFHEPIKEHLFGPMTVCIALVVGGVLMIGIEHFFWRKRKDAKRTTNVDQMLFRQALIIGCAQCLAMWPGTSRSMVTICAALIVGLDMVTAAEFSFLLALPTLGAATIYEGLKSHNELLDAAGVDGLLIGLVVSGLVAAVAVKLFVKWLTRGGLIPFGVYRVALGVAVYLILM